ncbi:catalytic domain of ctd-like phosphatase [Rhizoctonia solani]|uniref:Catalytic domain of ctd-like phosphatase n=1 Tax=Rhizoctonia solani TaxID=456999 RepID=A0A8H7M2B2_9AGAM|nr:catalytic domain of ctd-like phosphatase [Rhizoctonia solani]
MNDLTNSNGVLDYLSNTQFAAADVQRLTGGFTAFSYRVSLSTPLEDGSTTLIIKHYEDYVAFAPEIRFESTRSDFEYNALMALWDCGLINHDSVIQVPRPIHYDERLTQFSYHANIQAVASGIGSALGIFLGRLHEWGSSTEHRQLFLYPHRQDRIFALFANLSIRSATKFGVKEGWLESMLSEESRRISIDDRVLAMGDLSLSTFL